MSRFSRTSRFGIRRTVLTGVATLGLAVTLASCSSGGSSSSSSPKTQLSQGIAQSRAGNYTQAEHLFGDVINNSASTKAEKALAFYNLGVIHQNIGPLRTTLIDYLNAVKYDPKFPAAWFNLAVAESKINSKQALVYYNKILAIKPGDTNTLFNSGLIMYAEGNTAQGAARIKQAISQDAALAARVPANVKLG